MKNSKDTQKTVGRTTKGTDGWPKVTYTAEDLADSARVAAGMAQSINETVRDEGDTAE